jgi:hypothetical protein
MYEIHCENCGEIGFHPSRTGAEIAAEAHRDETGHDCLIDTMTETAR